MAIIVLQEIIWELLRLQSALVFKRNYMKKSDI